ncbi:MAG: PadR family transcriptional regulator [Anaerolineales bacterium]|nr:MAG: PadR family transcriptional regulator [Anaerolineales bacterium]
MKILTRTEETIMLAVRALAPEAYGLALGEHLKRLTGKRWSVGAIYIPLERLEQRGLLAVREGEPTPQRGGRSKRYYSLTPKGLKALNEARQLHEALWAAIPSSEQGLS